MWNAASEAEKALIAVMQIESAFAAIPKFRAQIPRRLGEYLIIAHKNRGKYEKILGEESYGKYAYTNESIGNRVICDLLRWNELPFHRKFALNALYLKLLLSARPLRIFRRKLSRMLRFTLRFSKS
jgi:hypothetical protein